jgi:hypothetical protein
MLLFPFTGTSLNLSFRTQSIGFAFNKYRYRIRERAGSDHRILYRLRNTSGELMTKWRGVDLRWIGWLGWGFASSAQGAVARVHEPLRAHAHAPVQSSDVAVA